MSHVTHMNQSHHTNKWVRAHSSRYSSPRYQKYIQPFFRKEDLEIYRFCWYLRIYFPTSKISLLRYFQKIWWYKFTARLIPLDQVLDRLRIRSRTHELIVSRMNKSRMNESRHTYMGTTDTSLPPTHVNVAGRARNASCHTFARSFATHGWVMSHIMVEPNDSCQSVMSHIIAW